MKKISILLIPSLLFTEPKFEIDIGLNYFERTIDYWHDAPGGFSFSWKTAFPQYPLSYYMDVDAILPTSIYPNVSFKMNLSEDFSAGIDLGYCFSTQEAICVSETWGMGDFNNDGVWDEADSYSTMTVTQGMNAITVYFTPSVRIFKRERMNIYALFGIGIGHFTVTQKFENKEIVWVDYSNDGTIDVTHSAIKDFTINEAKIVPALKIGLGSECEIIDGLSLKMMFGHQFISKDFGVIDVSDSPLTPTNWRLGRWSLSGRLISISAVYKF